MTFIDEISGGVGAGRDVGELYGSLAGRLQEIVRLDVRAPDAVIEDACQVAWTRLLHHSHRVHRETVLAWLATTAEREAIRVVRRNRSELALDVELEDDSRLGTPHELIERRERLQEVERLPERQQRVVWLHAIGLTYTEIALHEGCTRRTVDRQLLRARHALRGD